MDVLMVSYGMCVCVRDAFLEVEFFCLSLIFE